MQQIHYNLLNLKSLIYNLYQLVIRELFSNSIRSINEFVDCEIPIKGTNIKFLFSL